MSQHERDIALMEALMESSADSYFSGRQGLDSWLRRVTFAGGFQRGWLAQKNEADRLRAAPAPEAAVRRYDIYLSGPMTGLPEMNFPAFHAEATRLRALGYTVVNPAELTLDPNASWHECLRTDLKALLDCAAIAMMPGWEQSAGAHLEMHIAHRVGIKILQAREITA